MSNDKVRKGVKRSYFTSYNLIFETDLSIYAKMVYIYMCRRADSNSQSFPSHALIAQQCSCSITSVKVAIRDLIKAKLVTTESRYRKTVNGKAIQTTNLYIVYDRPYDTIPQEELDLDNYDEEQGEDITPQQDATIDTGRDTPPSEITVDGNNNTRRHTPPPQAQDVPTTGRHTPPPQAPHDYEGIPNLRTTHIEGQPIYQSPQDENEKLLIDGLNSIFENCEIDLYNEPQRTTIKNCITDMFFSPDFARSISLPQVIVQERLKKCLTLSTIDRALEKYRSAIEANVEITAPTKYFQKCIWSSINDTKIDLFSLGG